MLSVLLHHLRHHDSGIRDLQDLNGDVSHFTAIVSVPDTNTVKVIYGLGFGTAAIGQVSPLANKILALFGKGGVALGPAQTIVLDATLRNKKLVRNLTDSIHWWKGSKCGCRKSRSGK